jgi:hypothetical protein
MANEHIKRYLVSLFIKELQLKTIKRYYLILTGITKIKKIADSKW